MRVLLFAAARAQAGAATVDISVPDGARVDALLRAVGEQVPALAALLPKLRVAVNQEFAGAADVIPVGAEVALIPPVAGG